MGTTRLTSCGFCSDGNHQHCPSGVRNGDGRIWRCQCGCDRSQQIRCTDCGTRTPDNVNPETWRCIDPDACQARIEHSLHNNATIRQIRQIQAARGQDKETNMSKTKRIAADAQTKATEAEAPKAKPAPPRSCACGCEETTGGGLFRPGHDSRLLSALVAATVAGETTVAAQAETWSKRGLSDALYAKYVKRSADAEAKAVAARNKAEREAREAEEAAQAAADAEQAEQTA